MKAVIIENYGSIDELKYTEVDEPKLKDNDVLIEIAATSVNPVDWKIREGYLKGMLDYNFPLTLGLDAAGTIKEIGKKVTKFRVGDKVFTRPDITRNGTYAEYVAVDENLVAKKPENQSFEEAASIPLVGLTSWQCLDDFADIKQGDKVLIHAGSGGVGSFAIQLAKSLGAWVATTCSTKNVEFVKSLGADKVIDYRNEDFTHVLADMDIVFDTLGGDIQTQSYDVLKEEGVLVSIADQPDQELSQTKKVKAGYVFLEPDGEQLAKIGEMIEQGKIRANVGTVMKLEEIQEAHRLSETHHAKGKIVLRVG
ncbi:MULTISPECIES: NADP-dependent oxidoreductase [Lentibacillus]|uniref:NADP-dependent oxidoreductase n=2 Tax=Lentibacillus TaxID=175304 RepID=A0A4Y9A7F1_9BACI|nr:MULTISPECIES: NADP-dependent oxidoreductase [Lentibacillus]TFJ91688.1 NADP-dependent oxidoreductase [Lentibacillus salicampi]TMN20914.1 NADP-dependent oxidoreductase [Lentibacillus cibarius]